MNTSKKFGFPIEVWNEAKSEMKEILYDVARQRGFITYSDLANQVSTIKFQPDWNVFHQMLGEISVEEDKEGRGMLSVIVVHKYGDMQPGKGFYKLASSLNRDASDEIKCWVEEFKRVYAYWSI